METARGVSTRLSSTALERTLPSTVRSTRLSSPDGPLHRGSLRHRVLSEGPMDTTVRIAWQRYRADKAVQRPADHRRPRCPTSAPRGTRAEGTEPFAHRHRGVFGVSSAPDGGPVSKAACPRGVASRDPQQAQTPRLSKCARNDRTAHQANNPTSAILTPCQPSREPAYRGTATHTRQPATTAPSETPTTTLHHPAKHGKSPVLSRDPRPGGHS